METISRVLASPKSVCASLEIHQKWRKQKWPLISFGSEGNGWTSGCRPDPIRWLVAGHAAFKCQTAAGLGGLSNRFCSPARVAWEAVKSCHQATKRWWAERLVSTDVNLAPFSQQTTTKPFFLFTFCRCLCCGWSALFCLGLPAAEMLLLAIGCENAQGRNLTPLGGRWWWPLAGSAGLTTRRRGK